MTTTEHQKQATLFVQHCADLVRTLDATRALLCSVASSGVSIEGMGKAADIEEALNRARTALCFRAFDVADAIKNRVPPCELDGALDWQI